MSRPVYTQLRHLHDAPSVVHLECRDWGTRLRFLCFALVVAVNGRGDIRYGDATRLQHPRRDDVRRRSVS